MDSLPFAKVMENRHIREDDTQTVATLCVVNARDQNVESLYFVLYYNSEKTATVQTPLMFWYDTNVTNCNPFQSSSSRISCLGLAVLLLVRAG